MDEIVYNRENYLKDMLDIMKSGKAEAEIREQLDTLLGKVEKDVAIRTFESNMKVLPTSKSRLVRI